MIEYNISRIQVKSQICACVRIVIIWIYLVSVKSGCCAYNLHPFVHKKKAPFDKHNVYASKKVENDDSRL